MDAATFNPETLFTPEHLANPYPTYDALRPHTPMRLSSGEPGMPGESAPAQVIYPFMQYRHVYDALRDHETFSSEQNAGALVLIGNDPPRHTHLRKIVNRVFTPRRVAEAEPWIAAISTELFDAMGTGEADFVDDYTMPLPVKVIARLLGIPGDDYRQFKEWSDSFIGQESAQSGESMGAMLTYFAQMAAKRRESHSEDLITALVSADVEGEKLAEWEVLSFCVLLLVAGNETTTNLMSNMANILARRPDLWRQLKEDRSLVEPFIEETLRYESPVQLLFRRTTRDVGVGGTPIPQGSTVGIYFGAANRDAGGFDAPDEFRLDRKLATHVAFGYGIHFCLGAPLARTEARITLNALLDRYATIESAGEGTRLSHSPIVFGFQRLPLVLGA